MQGPSWRTPIVVLACGTVAVLEKGWLGGGNTGRNTTVVRSNYLPNHRPERPLPSRSRLPYTQRRTLAQGHRQFGS